MTQADLTQVYFLIYFLYGLAFFGMGIAMALESGRSPILVEARVLRPLAAFGLLHGTHEWFESYLLLAHWSGVPLPDWLAWLRLGLLVTSFYCLFLFAYHLLRLTSAKSIRKRIIRFSIAGLYVAGILISAVLTYRQVSPPWLDLIDGLARYLLAVPASLLAALALRARARQARAENFQSLKRFFSLASLGFWIYALTQFFVHPLAMIPAVFINQDSFLAFVGFPIQVVRTLMAFLIAFGLLRAAQLMEAERNLQLSVVQQARLEALQQREALRRELLRHTVRAQEDERARIARELHDETAQTLSAFSLELATLRSMLKRQKDATAKVEHLQDLGRSISQELYRLVYDLRPAQLDDLGLVPALKSLLEQDCCPKGMQVSIEVEGSSRRLDPLVETVLFRVSQEALNNVARHAATRHADLRLTFEDEKVRLKVADQGQGFDISESFTAPRGWGLAGMRERVESLGGEFFLNSLPGWGTTVEVIIPLAGK